MNGIITDIQRFSLNDGPGIRTTVFFKGCNMNCLWCHNPETISFKKDLLFFESKCINCGYCFGICPQKAHKISDGKHIIDRNICTGCGKCVDVCYAEALKFSSREADIQQVMDEIIQDKPYYDQSGGGVTLSGGEVFCQLDFANEIVRACKKESINVAVETNLYHSFEKILPVISEFDLIMFDIKIFDDEAHKKYTGVGNKLIFENARKAEELGIPIIVRTPLIPNVTDTENNLTDIAEFVSTMKNVKYYELLNFNPLGGSKYESMEQNNSFGNVKPLPEKRLNDISNMLKKYNIKIS